MRSRSDGPLGRRLIVGLVAVLGVLAATACNGPKKAATTVTTASGAGGTATTVTTAPGSGRPLDVEICEDRAVLPCDMQSVHVALPLAGTNVRLTWSNVRPGAGALGLGAWSLSPIVAFDPATGVFQDGGGRRRLVDAFRITLPSGDPGLAVASADSTVVFEFDSAGRHLASLDARTGAVLAATTWGPDGVEALSQLGAPGITVIRASGVVSEIRTTTGYATSLIIADGVPSAIVQPDGPDVRVTSDSTGRVTSVVRGVQRDAFEYDQAGRLTVAKHGNVRSSIERTAIENGFSVTTRSPLGRVTVDSVTGKGQTMRREHVDASGLRTTSERTPTTSIITYPDGTSTTTEFAPDLRFGWNSLLVQSSTLTLPDGATFSASETRTWTPDGLHVGEPVAMKWQRETAGIATTATYEPRSRTMTFTDADGRAVVTRFDDSGRPIASGYEGGPVTTRTLDETGRTLALTISTGGDGLTWTITGEAGLRSTTDPLGRTWQEGFDSAGRRRAVMDPAGTVFITGYDDTGRLAEVSLPNGTHRWTRGPDGQITTFEPPTSSTALSTTRTVYDADGALSTVTAGKTDVQQITRDGSGRVATQTIGRTLDYTYADDGSVRSVSDGDTTTTYQWNGPLLVGVDEDGRPAVSITYDGTGRVVGEQVGSDAPRILQYSAAGLLVTADTAHFTYDAALPLVTRLTVGDTTEARTYDAFGRLTAREVRSSNTVLFQERLARNKLGMVAASDEQTNGTNRSSTYEYDPRDRLVGVKHGDSSEQFEYDANGNMLRRTIGGAVTPSTIGTDDALLHAGDAEYKYDPAGRLARRSDPAGATTYTYDSDSALAAVDLPDGRRVVYEVDALGRRTAKSVDGTTVDRWVYGVRTLGPIAHVDASGNVDATFTYEADSYTPVSMERDGVVYRLVTDVRGSVRQVVDTSTGAVVESIEYDPWGAVTADSAPGFQPFGFGGGLVDADTGLVRFGARDYDPNARRWTAPDPIGFASGSTNLYAFADDNPVTHRDPSGLRSVCVITFGCAGQFGTGGGFTVGGGLSDDGHGVGVADAGVTHGTPTVGCNIQFTCVGLGEGETLSDNESFDVSVGPVNFGVDQTPRGGEGVHGGVGISWPPFAISVPSNKFDDQQPLEPDPLDPFENCGSHCTSDEPPPDPKECSGSGNCAEPDPCHVPLLCDDNGRPVRDPGGDAPPEDPRSGKSRGDPHLTTMDGVTYDFQAAGEFVLLRSTEGDLEIQTRQVPFGAAGYISVNSDVAMKVGSDTLEFQAGITLLNGIPANLSGVAALPGGGSVTGREGGVVVTWPDGSFVGVTIGSYAIDLSVTLADARKGRLQGLLAPFDGNAQVSELVASDGRRFAASGIGHADLYDEYGASWRVSASSSLFTYAPGQGPDTFYIADFPATGSSDPPASALEAANVTCGDAGVSGADLATCAYDLAASGDEEFVRMSAIQARHETGEWRRGSSVAGEVENLGSNEYTLHAATGEVGYLAWTGGCPGSEHLQWELWDATQTTRLYLAFGCHDIGRVVFPTAGQYVIVVSSPEGATGKYQLEWTATQPDSATPWTAGTTVSGALAARGERDTFNLTAATGEVGYLAWTGGCPGSEHLQWELWDATQTTRLYLAFGCHDIGRVVFPTAGQYVIVVSSPEGATGKYQLEWRDR